jgi:hypothetical protein
MTRACLWPAALVWLSCFAAAALAQLQPPQTSPPVPPLGSGAPGVPQEAKAGPSADMQENVEILRRLLDRAFLEAYGLPAHKPRVPIAIFAAPGGIPPTSDGVEYKNVAVDVAPQGDPHAGAGPHTEGVYLKDYGIVYTATLPLPPFSVVGGTGAAPGNKPAPDDWDRIRKEIHGETPDQAVNPVPGHTPLSQVILKVLADNGRHFTGLQDGEKITVAVTFRGAATCANCHANPWGNGPLATFGAATRGVAPTDQPPQGASNPSPDGGFLGSPGAPQYVLDARNDILLGDLHMKQGKGRDAIDAYQKAAQHLSQVLRHREVTDPGLTTKDVPALLTAVDLGNKLAAAYVQAGDADAAGKALKATADFAKQAEKLTGVAVPVGTSPQPAAQALPSKLVVTVSKKQLDDVASGKLTFDAFCKAATVEYITPPADKK